MHAEAPLNTGHCDSKRRRNTRLAKMEPQQGECVSFEPCRLVAGRFSGALLTAQKTSKQARWLSRAVVSSLLFLGALAGDWDVWTLKKYEWNTIIVSQTHPHCKNTSHITAL